MRIRLVVVLTLLMWHSVAHAAVLTVTNTNDSGQSSLRGELMDAMGASGLTIVFDLPTPPPWTITLASSLVFNNINANVTITGPGADQLTIQGGAFPVFTIDGTVQLSGVTIRGGANGAKNGGGILLNTGSLTLLNSVIAGNSAAGGSAIYAATGGGGALVIRNSTISGNIGPSAVFGGVNTSVFDSTITGNTGTAIVFPNMGTTLTIDRSTISINVGGGGVGGLQVQAGTANVRNSTFSANTGTQGGDFGTVSGATLSLLNVTATGDGSLFAASTVTLCNTLLAGPTPRCLPGSAPTSQGHNLSSDMTCNLTAPTDKPGVDPLLGALAANGGASLTHALLAGSPALNAGDTCDVHVPLEPMDQRGKPRVQFAAVDIGAIEVTEPLIMTQPTGVIVDEGAPLVVSVAATNQNSATPLTYQWRKDQIAIADATSATFNKPAATVADGGMYDVLIGNDGGTIASMAAAVTVTPAVHADDGAPANSAGGGCCSATGGGASSALFGLAVAALLVAPRRRRASSRRR